MSPCKFEKTCTDWVPTPFGSGNCPMDTSECQNPDATDEEMDNCGPACLLYEECLDESDLEINPEEEP